MKISEVSRRYAKALMALAKQKGQHARAHSELEAIAKVFKTDATVHDYFLNPLIGPDAKLAVVKNSFQGKGLSEEVYNTLLLLAEKNRMGKFEEIVAAFEEQMDVEQNVTRGSVKSAKALSEGDKKDLEGKITKILNKKIILTYKEDPTLLGGVVAQVGGWTFDDSIETHLIKLNEELNRRAN
ncbi:ATP synthase F1 subunit delta [Bdellovibrio sp. HCB337]|uniref:ATP synthase F1 subunit delta n=1 Tax=Bdellovibrio sp. HCB337 TaxID=3394358 RepID=UPI0039A5A951